jgi:hypothetical protein
MRMGDLLGMNASGLEWLIGVSVPYRWSSVNWEIGASGRPKPAGHSTRPAAPQTIEQLDIASAPSASRGFSNPWQDLAITSERCGLLSVGWKGLTSSAIKG